MYSGYGLLCRIFRVCVYTYVFWEVPSGDLPELLTVLSVPVKFQYSVMYRNLFALLPKCTSVLFLSK